MIPYRFSPILHLEKFFEAVFKRQFGKNKKITRLYSTIQLEVMSKKWKFDISCWNGCVCWNRCLSWSGPRRNHRKCGRTYVGLNDLMDEVEVEKVGKFMEMWEFDSQSWRLTHVETFHGESLWTCEVFLILRDDVLHLKFIIHSDEFDCFILIAKFSKLQDILKLDHWFGPP